MSFNPYKSEAKNLAEAIKKEGGAHLIYTGKLAIDGSVSAVGPMLAELLKIPHVSGVSSLEYKGATLVVLLSSRVFFQSSPPHLRLLGK